MIDYKIINKCKLQNRDAQRRVYDVLLPYLRAICRRYLRDVSFEKDVLQESFLKIFTKIEQYNPELASFKKWATKITINHCLNYNARVIKTPHEEFQDQHEILCLPKVIRQMSEDHLLSILKQMPVRQFEVFNLYVIDSYGHEEIARILAISEDVSRKRLSRARQWIKKTFQQTDSDSLPTKII